MWFGVVLTAGRREQVIPSAARLLGSLRDLGYDFVNAVADLIDNSVSAGASHVDVTIAFDGPASWVRIADDGSGMTGAAVSEAMRLGSGVREYARDDLGKFGLGLKTASLSQARAITVATRTDPARRQIECRQLDLDEIDATDRWEIVHPAAADRPAEAIEPLRESTGTVVVWTKLDRVLSRSDPFGGWARRQLQGLAERLDTHIGMVFGRFLTGQARRSTALSIHINGTEVEPWDPFCSDEDAFVLSESELLLRQSLVRYRPFVLPAQREFSDDVAWRRASGPRQWNAQQGLYIYRADRMIQSGGWSRLRSPDEHTKLARAALEFWPELDEAFEINISKMRVKLPEQLREDLKPLVALLCRTAEDRYRGANRRSTGPAPARPATTKADTSAKPPADGAPRPAAAPATSSPTRGVAPSDDPPPTSDQSPVADDDERAPNGHLGEALGRAAERAAVQQALERIRDEMRRTEPGAARDIGW